MSRGLVLDPTSFVDLGGASAGPPLGPIAGKTIGFRHDMYWRSWTWAVEEWGTLAVADGAKVAFWEHRPPTGKETAGMLESLDAFLAGVDATVVGMANCGSCTMWTIHDALRSLDRTLPTVVVATEHFVDLARGLARRSGRGEIRLQALPFPFEGLPEAEVRELARALYRPMLAELGAEVAAP